MLLKQHCKLRPFRLGDGVSASGLLECDDSRLRIVQVEEEVGPRGVRDLVRKVSVTTSEYSVPWIVDGDVGGCLLCSAPFTVFRRRHHCRACGILICSSCFADSKIKVKALRRFERPLPFLLQRRLFLGPALVQVSLPAGHDRGITSPRRCHHQLPLNGRRIRLHHPPDLPRGRG